MKSRTGLLLAHALALPLLVSAAYAQVTELGPADQPLNTQPARSDLDEPRQVFAPQELDQILAPIALYPDSLLSQILMASTYPIEVVQAARWSRANPGLRGDAAVRAVEQQSWDPSVKSLVAFPQVLSMMDEKLDWMERLGDAFLSQQRQVMDAVQELRQKAQAAGNLQSNEIVHVQPQGQTIVIEQANPQVVYVPYYDPTVIYGPWWYPAYPPVYWGPWPGYYARSGFSSGFFWGSGITIGTGFYFGAFDWPHRHVEVVNVNNFYYQPPARAPYGAAPGGWYHDPAHRRGVPYRDPVLRHEFVRPGPGGRPEALRDFRGNEPSRAQGSDRRAQSVPDNARPSNARSDINSPPNAPNRNRSDVRIAPAQPSMNTAPSQPNATVPGQPNANVPSQANVHVPSQPKANVHPSPRGAPVIRPAPNTTAPSQPNGTVPGQPNANAYPAPRTVPRAPVTRPTQPMQARPNGEPRSHIFNGLGQGPAARDSSQRGGDSVQRAILPPRPVAQPQSAAPIARPQAAPMARPQAAWPVFENRPSGGGGDHGQHQSR